MPTGTEVMVEMAGSITPDISQFKIASYKIIPAALGAQVPSMVVPVALVGAAEAFTIPEP